MKTKKIAPPVGIYFQYGKFTYWFLIKLDTGSKSVYMIHSPTLAIGRSRQSSLKQVQKVYIGFIRQPWRLEFLDINLSGKSRNDIIQKKVVDFHMTTNFDVTQLDNLPLAALPQLLAILSNPENNCLHGTFWLTKNRLELSEVRARSICG